MKYRCIGCNEIHEDNDFCEKEERFEKVVEYKESREEYFGDIFGFIILAPFIMLMEFFDKLSDYIKDNRKVYWRRIKD